jgi:hypothetical protein
MKTLIQKTGYVRSIGSKAMIALVISTISVLSIASAHADDDDWGRGGHHGHREWRGDRDEGYRPRYQQPYSYAQPVFAPPPVYYSQPVYVPPPVYYAPQQSPSISLFLPFHL